MNFDNKIAIKNTILINISGNSTLNQRRLFNLILHKIFDKLSDFSVDYFYFNVREFAELVGNETTFNYANFKNDFRALMKTVVSWDIIDRNNEISNWEASVLVASAVFGSGRIQIEIPKLLREKIVENKQYIKLNLALQNKFSSKYSLIIYELCKEFYREKDGKGETPWLTLDNFRYLMGVEEGKYSDLRNLKKRIINIAVKEINKLSEISIGVDFKKESNKTSGIKFIIVKNPNTKSEQSLTTLTESISFPTLQSIPIPPNPQYTNITDRDDSFYRDKQDKNTKLKATFASLGIKPTQIDEWLIQHETEYLQAKYDLTIEQLKLGKIKTSPSGFLIRAIEQDFGSKNNLVEDILKQDALEARKINPETIVVDPFEFLSYEDLLVKMDTLRTEYYNPIVIQSELENAMKLKWKIEKLQMA